MSEADQRRSVIRGLKSLHAVSIESPSTGAGIPDVNFADGWIELKWLRAWPKRENTVVRLRHFTKNQRDWLRDRYEADGNVWLLLQCRMEWLMFTGLDAATYVGRVSREGLYQCATVRWTNGMKYAGLIKCLTT